MPKISIVLPTYNGEEYLSASINSIINQTYQDWELIIVDDCSKDKTADIAGMFSEMDSRIKVIHNSENLKLPETLNVGFRKAKGDYFTWTSDDNLYLKNALEEMVHFLDQDEAYDMVSTGMILVDDELRYLNECVEGDEEKMYMGNVVGASFMYRRSVLETVGEYSSDMFCVEDYDYWVRILKAGMKIKFIRGCFYLYRQHSKSLTSQRQEMIKSQTRKMWIRHFDWVMSGRVNDPSKVLRLYQDLLLEETYKFLELKEKFMSYINLIKYDVAIPEKKDIVIYGAGKIGRECAAQIDNRNKYFIDKNNELIGNIIEGVEVISFDEAEKMIKDELSAHLVICVWFDKQYEVMESLVDMGYDSFSVMGHITREIGKINV